tara:strand:+ start:1062 stop:1259 length:198 start_codon:yes stop_codon:yes gene_type:complete
MASSATETRNVGKLIEFQVQFMILMLNVGREDDVNRAVQKILAYCDYLKTQDLDVEVIKEEEKVG